MKLKLDLNLFYKAAFWVSLIGIFVFIADFGFTNSENSDQFFHTYYFIVLFFGLSSTLLRYKEHGWNIKRKVLVFDAASVLFTVIVIGFYFFSSTGVHWQLMKLAVFLTFIREYSDLKINFKRTFLNPGQLFILSFVVLIFVGALLLSLPTATHNGIPFIDAFFTSTSAVCVTGLAVVDTGSYFTVFGQVIIMGLIQIGGLGILTFASYFSYFFKGGTSFENQLALGDLTNSNLLGDVFSILKYVILITFTIEFFSAVLIFTSIDSHGFESVYDQAFFSAFHAVSAFCNAGFSTLPLGAYEVTYRFNYFFQLILIFTFVLGGLGFPIVSNLLKYFKYKLSTLFKPKKNQGYKPWVLNLNSRIALITAFVLVLVGTLGFYFLEYNNTLAEHGEFGKVVTALFGATTPRTAGFNSIDNAAMTYPTLMLVIFLMWVGASPNSTGGGIKTSTFAVATMNIISLARGKTRIELYRREISDLSVRRAFAIISLSLVVIGFGIMFILHFDPYLSLMDVAFECFSAYSTVGLSLGITGNLTVESKIVLSVLMFVGRVSMLSIVIAVFKKIKHKNYRYPSEDITIN